MTKPFTGSLARQLSHLDRAGACRPPAQAGSGSRGRVATRGACCLAAIAAVCASNAQASSSAFGDGALQASASISPYGTDVDTRPATAKAGEQASVALSWQDPDGFVDSAGVRATAAFGALGGSSAVSSSWDPNLNGPFGHYGSSPGGATTGPYTYFGDTVTIDAAGRAGQTGVAHASLLVSSQVGNSLPNAYIGASALEQAYAGFEAEIVTGAVNSGGEGGVSHATAHLIVAGSTGISNGPAFCHGANQCSFNEMTVQAIQPNGFATTIYDGVLQPRYQLDFDIPIVFGEAFSLNARLETGAYAGVSEPSLKPDDPAYPFARYAFSQIGADLTWGGISSVTVTSPDLLASVRPSSSVTLTDFTVTSGSGADYLHALSPVPEPTSGVLCLIGGIALAWRWRANAKDDARDDARDDAM